MTHPPLRTLIGLVAVLLVMRPAFVAADPPPQASSRPADTSGVVPTPTRDERSEPSKKPEASRAASEQPTAREAAPSKDPKKGSGQKPANVQKPVEAKPVDPTKRAEAAQRFDRALKLFDAGDNAGALAEFRRIYEILPEPMVLYNIGLVYAAMGRPVDAVDALEPLAGRGGLPPAHLERAKQTLADQKARIGRLTVSTIPESARIEVDNMEVARTPLSAPIRISEGTHIIGAVAEGYAPARKEVLIAGNADATVKFELIFTQGKQLANLIVRTRTVGAEVKVDGQTVGKTPLSTSVTLTAGSHVVELSRPGYGSVRREIDVGEGATGEIAFELAVDPSALGNAGATLVLDSSESPAELTVDAERKGLYRGPLRLPRGPHHITVSVAGFVPVDRDIMLDGSQPNVVRVVFEPTPETRKNYRSSALLHRTWGWVGILGGAAIAGSGTALSVIASSQKSDAQAGLDAISTKYDASEPPCDYRSGFAAEASLPSGQRDSYLCNKTISDARGKIDAAQTRRIVGFVGIGAGSAIAITGLVLLVTGIDPDKYERAPSSSLGQARHTQFSVVPGPGEVGTALRVRF